MKRWYRTGILLAATLAASAHAATRPVVCLDPGHPSEINDGRAVQNGLTEVDVAWRVSLQVRSLLERGGVRVVMTKRSRDRLVTNRRRAEIANRSGCALMVRLHCDTGQGTGYAVYYPDRTGRRFGVTGPSRAVMAASRRAAAAVEAGMAAKLNRALQSNGVMGDSRTSVGRRQGALTGSIFRHGPVLTIEMAVLSNKRDAKFIGSQSGQKSMAQAIADGVVRWLALQTNKTR